MIKIGDCWVEPSCVAGVEPDFYGNELNRVPYKIYLTTGAILRTNELRADMDYIMRQITEAREAELAAEFAAQEVEEPPADKWRCL